MFSFAPSDFADLPNDMRIFRYQVCSREITESKTELAALLGRVGGMAGGTAQFQSADGSSFGIFWWSGVWSVLNQFACDRNFSGHGLSTLCPKVNLCLISKPKEGFKSG